MKFRRLPLFLICTCVALGTSTALRAQADEAPPSDDTIYNLTAVDPEPVPKRRIRPDFPKSLRKRDTPAEITLRFVVTSEGRVTDISIVKFNDSDMVEPAYIAYEKATFTPGRKAGKPVNVRMEVTHIYPEPKVSRKDRDKDED
jgi:outer membrane biosynthesis protein TonB